MDHITSTIGATSTVRYLNNLISCYSSRSPKIDCFPEEPGDLYELYGDKEIPGVKEFVKTDSVDECLELAEIECHVCGVTVQSFTVQSELKRILQQQEAGLDVSFKCSRCRDCKDCKRGAGQEMMSMRQEAEQEKIRESIYIDRTQNRLIAKLPFLCDPSEKLKDNTKAATKRLENVK